MKTNKYRISLLIAVCAILFVFALVEVKAGDIFNDYNWSRINTVHDNRLMQKYHTPLCNLVDCTENKWFMGENLKDIGLPFRNVIYTPNLKNIIRGADGGISIITWQGKTLVYLGDEHGNAASTNCDMVKQCNDAITVLTDTDGPQNGVDARILMDEKDPTKFRPLNIPGILSYHPLGPNLDEDDFGPFTYASGVERGFIYPGDDQDYRTSSQLYLWYTVAVNTNHPQSFLTCSQDGIEFGACPQPESQETELPPARFFSDEKFIIVSPVAFGPYEWEVIDENDSCSLCKLKPLLTKYWFGYSQGMLIFASGGGAQNQRADDGGYRESPLYLAYMELHSLKVWYFTGDGWSTKEADAVPILSYEGKPPLQQKKYWFGEISVKMVLAHEVEDTYLVLLANHKNGVYYRTAPLLKPDVWSDPQLTCGIGYGPYILDGYIWIEEGNPDRLYLYHSIVAWNGYQPLLTVEPYGVFTTQLRLRQDPTDVNSPCGEPPVWPPQP
jgi:hypothetical protein